MPTCNQLESNMQPTWKQLEATWNQQAVWPLVLKRDQALFSPFSNLHAWLLLAEKDRVHGEQLQQQRQALLGPSTSHQLQGNSVASWLTSHGLHAVVSVTTCYCLSCFVCIEVASCINLMVCAVQHNPVSTCQHESFCYRHLNAPSPFPNG